MFVHFNIFLIEEVEVSMLLQDLISCHMHFDLVFFWSFKDLNYFVDISSKFELCHEIPCLQGNGQVFLGTVKGFLDIAKEASKPHFRFLHLWSQLTIPRCETIMHCPRNPGLLFLLLLPFHLQPRMLLQRVWIHVTCRQKTSSTWEKQDHPL